MCVAGQLVTQGGREAVVTHAVRAAPGTGWYEVAADSPPGARVDSNTPAQSTATPIRTSPYVYGPPRSYVRMNVGLLCVRSVARRGGGLHLFPQMRPPLGLRSTFPPNKTPPPEILATGLCIGYEPKAEN